MDSLRGSPTLEPQRHYHLYGDLWPIVLARNITRRGQEPKPRLQLTTPLERLRSTTRTQSRARLIRSLSAFVLAQHLAYYTHHLTYIPPDSAPPPDNDSTH